MRSALIYAAQRNYPNRFELVRTVAVGSRVYHNAGMKNNQRLAETINEVLVRLAATPDAKFVSQGDLICKPLFGTAQQEETDGVVGERGT